MKIRKIDSANYKQIITILNDWWNGRQMTDMLPKLFFEHFQETSFIMEEKDQIIGFLVGFLSQSKKKEAYIHFVGVHPEKRNLNIGKRLYNQFFEVIQQKGYDTVRCVTSPTNKASISYHTKMGFQIEIGDREVDGVSIHTDYDGPKQDRVLFVKKLY
ncbi:GNAT family N-acetyltransferase [Neobacillus ginsengisoli]|uniref:Ribosomal protein S18 acetylase RimI-like enzyme n=1 Tax=Neobacillus ginsengisoli TaxID=904295 RepID=A0ABT9Y424_9BACI|nr:GNAT family N-acetyltransferase [Neobacillus ginsengisoli]MDQ0202260.1 ribosomal protein S18 acetylase RimI-like enzyme [Neobacillus ginsengisoli]